MATVTIKGERHAARGILFTGEMVQAILAGRKTETRRVITLPKHIDPDHFTITGARFYPSCSVIHWPGDEGVEERLPPCLYGGPGDVLYVRETWAASLDSDGDMTEPLFYRASYDEAVYGPMVARFSDRATESWDTVGNTGWRPGIHLPATWSRIVLRVRGVEPQRICDITAPQALAEGVGSEECAVCNGTGDYDGAACFECDGEGQIREVSQFRRLWDAINGKRDGGRYAWERQPWVWRVVFEVLSVNGWEGVPGFERLDVGKAKKAA